MKSTRKIALALVALVVSLTSAGATQAAFGPTGSFGGYGTGAGRLIIPNDVATYADYVYVVEPHQHRISQFTSGGSFVRMWGKGVDTGAAVAEICSSGCQAGAAGSRKGELNWPMGIATDRQGNVWVAESDNNRLQKFSPEGEFIATYGFGVEDGTTNAYQICTSSCYAGIPGLGNGQFSSPAGVDIGPSGRIYISSAGNDRVQVLASNGTYLSGWGSPGVGNGDFDAPQDIVVDDRDYVWVADFNNFRVQKFTANGSYLGKLTGLNGAAGLAVGSNKLFIAESYSHRVDALELNGTQIGSFGWRVNIPGINMFERCYGAFVGTSPSCQPGLRGGGVGQFAKPRGVDTDGAGNVYIVDSNNHRVQRFGN